MITQDAAHFYESHSVYNTFEGVVLDREKGKRIARVLQSGKACILQNHGLLPLSIASEGGHKAVVRLLLAERGVEPDSKDCYGWTPLALASVSGRRGVVRLLLDTNVMNPDSRDSDGRISLSLAAQNWHPEGGTTAAAQGPRQPGLGGYKGFNLVGLGQEREEREVE